MHCIRIQYDILRMIRGHDSVLVCVWLVEKIADCHITLEKGETIHLHYLRIFVKKKGFTMMSSFATIFLTGPALLNCFPLMYAYLPTYCYLCAYVIPIY